MSASSLRLILLLALTGGLASPSLAQVQAPPFASLAYEFDSGPVANEGLDPAVVISFPVVVEGSAWMRLHFDEVVLAGDLFAGEGALLRMTALADGAIQEMDMRHLVQWQDSSAYFNGDTVLVEVLAQPGTGASRVVMRSVDHGLVPSLPESICGSNDDRILSSDPRSARLLPIGCTAWTIDDCAGCLLTAGHCQGGASVVQFNVPLSSGSGSINQPSPDDLVDEARCCRVGGRHPGVARGAEVGLEALHEGHEVPDGEAVRLHEDSQPRQVVDRPVNRVVEELPLQVSGKFERGGHGSVGVERLGVRWPISQRGAELADRRRQPKHFRNLSPGKALVEGCPRLAPSIRWPWPLDG